MHTIIYITPELFPRLTKAVQMFLARMIQLTHNHYIDLDESGTFLELVDTDGRQSTWGVIGVSEDVFAISGHIIVDLYDCSTEPLEEQREEQIRLSINTTGAIRQL